jgi:hypothetical protein
LLAGVSKIIVGAGKMNVVLDQMGAVMGVLIAIRHVGIGQT